MLRVAYEAIDVLVSYVKIEALDGLDTCVRIKYLYAQNNHIRCNCSLFALRSAGYVDVAAACLPRMVSPTRCSTLEGSSLKHFTFLKELRLYDNKLKNLHDTLVVLSKLHHLEDLDLFDNPLQEEENYRLQMIKAVPSLVVLDRHVITDGERTKAKRCDPCLLCRFEAITTTL